MTSCIGCPIHLALCYIETKSFVNYYYWQVVDLYRNLISDKIKRYFFQSVSILVILYGCTTGPLTNSMEKIDGNYTRTLRAVLNKSLMQHPKTAIRPLTSYLAKHRDKMIKTCWTMLVKSGRNHWQRSFMNSYTRTHLYWPTSKASFISSVLTLNAFERTCKKQWTIKMDGEW